MNSAKNQQLKAKAHSLKPVVIVGQSGLTNSVMEEIEITLKTHELIKIKIRSEKEARNLISNQIVKAAQAELIQAIGQIIVVYRKNPEKNR